MKRDRDKGLMLQYINQWEDKELYDQLMESFVSGKIDGIEFDQKFYKIWDKLFEPTYELEELTLKIQRLDIDKLSKFAELMGHVFVECDAFEPDSTLRDEFEISEEELRDSVKKALIESQKLSS